MNRAPPPQTWERSTIEKSALGRAIYHAAYLKGRFTLRSGRSADHYFDKYQFEADPGLLRHVAEGLATLVPEDVELLAGLELGGIPLATALSLATALPMVFVRKAPKTYGTAKLAEGRAVEGRRLVIVEDVITSGGQVVESARELIQRGAEVRDAICVIDREEGGRETLASIGVSLHALFATSELSECVGQDRMR